MYSGGDGGSVETAVVVGATDTLTGVKAEYEYVIGRHGRKDADWSVESQAVLEQGGRHYDVLNIKLKTGESTSYYFDITQFFGKFPGEPADESLVFPEAVCPHCKSRQRMIRTRLMGVTEVLECPSCLKLSREAPVWGRIVGAVFLISFALVLALGIATGVYFLVSMVLEEFSLGFAAIGLLLVLAAGYAEYRVIVAIRRCLKPRELFPVDGLLTSL